jgi:hypothetical protein
VVEGVLGWIVRLDKLWGYRNGSEDCGACYLYLDFFSSHCDLFLSIIIHKSIPGSVLWFTIACECKLQVFTPLLLMSRPDFIIFLLAKLFRFLYHSYTVPSTKRMIK